ncbi:MAG: phosphopentomutase [Firmicutes bacterium]|nr:phosphopentomutase [Bacillota bacterium]
MKLMVKRVILIVLDSVGVGELPDAAEYGDAGSNTLCNISREMGGLRIDNMTSFGIGNIDGMRDLKKTDQPSGSYGKLAEKSRGKDTVTGHWEISGIILEEPLKTFPNGFSPDIIEDFEKLIGTKVIGNKVASGTEIIKELGEEHRRTGYPIVYTSADSVFQIAANEEVIPLESLYRMCGLARGLFVGERTIGRVIARPFVVRDGEYIRTANRKDYALDPPAQTMLDCLKMKGLEVAAVGKIEDIFNKKGITRAVHIKNNNDGVDRTLEYMKEVDKGLIFTNLVDFDMVYGHRNNIEGYARALEEFDSRLPEILAEMKEDDVLILTADHGCDPVSKSTDHSREYVPLLVYGKGVRRGFNLGTRECFCDIGKTILDFFGVANDINGTSFSKEVLL